MNLGILPFLQMRNMERLMTIPSHNENLLFPSSVSKQGQENSHKETMTNDNTRECGEEYNKNNE